METPIILPQEIRFDEYRTAHHHVGRLGTRPYNVVRLTYFPTNVVFESANLRSQHANRKACLDMLHEYLAQLHSTEPVINVVKAYSLEQVLAMPGAYVISVNGENIGHTMRKEDVSKDNDNFLGVDRIIEFVHSPTFVEDIYTFDATALVYITPLLHTYSVTDIGGTKVQMQIAICQGLYPQHFYQLAKGRNE